ncbi:hypothetical protein EOD39_15474 [Acipenser ruthenus]|uniref:CCHC-type domain-containing protein n=1 Tax=Acipenser ruthenus TaxID=7906 RepID=A0A444V891_ACIRT|nr:hypothetical protein EOD39_15474 [Acipenser ruthenus]
MCLLPGHVVSSCPSFRCFECGQQVHYARSCRAVRCDDCHHALLSCVCLDAEDGAAENGGMEGEVAVVLSQQGEEGELKEQPDEGEAAAELMEMALRDEQVEMVPDAEDVHHVEGEMGAAAEAVENVSAVAVLGEEAVDEGGGGSLQEDREEVESCPRDQNVRLAKIIKRWDRAEIKPNINKGGE